MSSAAEFFQAWRHKEPNVGEELADIAIYVMGLAEMIGVDLEDEIRQKVDKNTQRVYVKDKGVLVKANEGFPSRERTGSVHPADRSSNLVGPTLDLPHVEATHSNLSPTDLLNEVVDHFPALDRESLATVGSGTEARVYSGALRDGRPVAVKVARAASLSTGNDPKQDTGAYLRQEAILTRHLAAHGVPVPEPIAANTSGDGPVFLVSEYVEEDATEPDARDVAQVLARIHSAPVPAIDLVCMEGSQNIDLVLTARVTDRLGRLNSMYSIEIEPPPLADILESCPPPPHRSLLHMDYRRANWLVSNTHLRAVVDWSNALVGDPALDLARSSETRAVGPNVIDAYEGPGKLADDPMTPRHLVYRLDAAVMLTHVFMSSPGNHDEAGHFLRRCHELCATLSNEGDC